MPHIVSSVHPEPAHNELSLLDLNHVSGGGTISTIVTGLKVERMKSSDKAAAIMDAYLRG